MKPRTIDKERRYHDALDDLLDQPIAFNPAFLRIINTWIADKALAEGKRYGNAAAPAAAIFLSQAWYWSKRTNDPDGWFYKSAKEWEDETGLTDNTQATCRKLLGFYGMRVIEEKLKGVPATVNYRVCKHHVYGLLGFQFPDPQETEIPVPQETGIPVPQESGIPTHGKPDAGGTGNLNTEITTKTTTEITKDSIWEKILSSLFLTVPRNTYTFLQAAQPVSFENDVLTLKAIDELACDWLRGNASTAIEKAFPGVIQRAAKVEFITEAA